jgi:hypothetical protein
MFVSGDFLVGLSFPVARVRLAGMVWAGLLASASQSAYGDGVAEVIRMGAPRAGPGIPELAGVRYRELAASGESAVLAVRWEATGPAGQVFPVLDADMTLAPAGELATRLSLAGVCRLPLAGLGTAHDRASSQRPATAAIQSLLSRLAAALNGPGGAADVSSKASAKAARAPGIARTALTGAAGVRRAGPGGIEYGAAQVSDGLVQLADGVLDFAGGPVLADQRQGGFQG